MKHSKLTDISDSLGQLVADSKQHATAEQKESVREQLDVLVDRVKGLRKLTAEATFFLPMYELRRAQEVQPSPISHSDHIAESLSL